VVCPVRLDGTLDGIPLALVGSSIISGNWVVPEPDCHVDFGLFDRFELLEDIQWLAGLK